MSAEEIYERPEQASEDERRSEGRRFAIILGATILLLFALTVGALYLIFKSKQRKPLQLAARAAGSAALETAYEGNRRRRERFL